MAARMTAVIALCAISCATHPGSEDRSEVRAFFDGYVERSASFDPSLGELYAPDARIITVRDGTRRIELTGAQWAERISRVMPLAKKRGDVSAYDEIRVAPHGAGFRITAERMPRLKCVVDESYHMDVERDGESWQIVEEYSETVSLSRCEPSPRLAAKLRAVQREIEPHLPIDLDADSRLESVEVQGPALIYHQRLHTASASELDPDRATEILREVGFQNACGPARTRQLVEDGATIRYSTVGRDGALIANIDIAPGMCP